MLKKINLKVVFICSFYISSFAAVFGQNSGFNERSNISNTMDAKIVKTEAEWRKQLSPEQYRITREKGTERAFTGEYFDCHDKGIYICVCCGNELFSSDTKFDSGTGWPSFWAPIGKNHVDENTDRTLGIARTEVICHRCGAHLGHVFDDGPKPTGLRYCMNSASLKLIKK